MCLLSFKALLKFPPQIKTETPHMQHLRFLLLNLFSSFSTLCASRASAFQSSKTNFTNFHEIHFKIAEQSFHSCVARHYFHCAKRHILPTESDFFCQRQISSVENGFNCAHRAPSSPSPSATPPPLPQGEAFGGSAAEIIGIPVGRWLAAAGKMLKKESARVEPSPYRKEQCL